MIEKLSHSPKVMIFKIPKKGVSHHIFRASRQPNSKKYGQFWSMINRTKPFVITRQTYNQILRLLLLDKTVKKPFGKLKQDDVFDTIDIEAVHIVVVNDEIKRRNKH